MLKNIPEQISPELMKVLMEMGHGDEIILADGNFPASSHAKRLIRLDGLNIPEVLQAILIYFPLDEYVDDPAILMEVVEGDPVEPLIWEEYEEILTQSSEKGKEVKLHFLQREAFYERAKTVYAIVATSEKAQYANILLKKGVIKKT
ncbi:fucose isomerase [Alkalihalobacillus oceani]|uniref:Fucose isomerase n=1 Tax=Halalkalibacter oceani TaxID=1653776 RepID=A0A9X2IN23_9BACI|nr:RbsD/FucU domain-containing protein [Halalkalibacter oceani]MCM3712972.1 fucose isomerase [Halalkalibacter oceani]